MLRIMIATVLVVALAVPSAAQTVRSQNSTEPGFGQQVEPSRPGGQGQAAASTAPGGLA